MTHFSVIFYGHIKIMMYFSRAIFAVLLCILLSNKLWAADKVELTFHADNIMQSGRISDGAVFGRGMITYNGNHTGFRLWGDNLTSNGRPGSYILKGVNNDLNILRLRIESSGVPFSSQSENKIDVLTNDDTINFYFVSDGDQYIATDRYVLEINGVVLLSDLR
ncbi:hypothetical protein PGS62_07535 [Yersinia rochesterensis]|uniref:AfaD family invasin n=1 Tax=Yersinia TaxID=629 RepID=UPI00223F55BC|nr:MULTISPECIES: AfaD family invasin [Yersinia]MDA5543799.1 hypothetical protein [Yersinia rochesterensis]UZM74491.1 hypothetical protein OP863_16360 [Yersinia sp. SCPM-O-B-9106 (C-191)]